MSTTRTRLKFTTYRSKENAIPPIANMWRKFFYYFFFPPFRYSSNAVRAEYLQKWQHGGGVLLLGYELFRTLVNVKAPKATRRQIEQITNALLNPGRLRTVNFSLSTSCAAIFSISFQHGWILLSKVPIWLSATKAIRWKMKNPKYRKPPWKSELAEESCWLVLRYRMIWLSVSAVFYLVYVDVTFLFARKILIMYHWCFSLRLLHGAIRQTEFIGH
jgi:hypothetical protein